MSMASFVADIGRRLLNFRAKGWMPAEMWVSEEAEKVINEALLKERCVDVEFIPRLLIHGIPVAVHRRMPPGAVWFVLKGGKK